MAREQSPECERCGSWFCERCGWKRISAARDYLHRCHRCGWQDGTFEPVRHQVGSILYEIHEPTGHDHFVDVVNDDGHGECPGGCPYRVLTSEGETR